MITIHKYPLLIEQQQKVKMRRGFKILSLDVQDGVPCIWALIDDEAELINVPISTYGTGHNIARYGWNAWNKFVGTYQLDGFVGHVFYSGGPV